MPPREMGTLLTSMAEHLIIIGASARAAAQSAIRAGYLPWCIDLFADRDLQVIAPVKRCPRGTWPGGILELIRDAPPGPVLFTGGMENHLDVVAAIVRHRPSLGSSPQGMATVRSPDYLSNIISLGIKAIYAPPPLEQQGIYFTPQACKAYDRVPWHAPVTWTLRWLAGMRFLIKPRNGAGGRGIRVWSPFRRVGTNEFVQRFVRGVPVSGVFVAHNNAAMLVAISEQIIGDAAFGARPFAYVGNIGPLKLSTPAVSQLQFVGMTVAPHLEGVFGVDAILVPRPKDGSPGVDAIYPIEINPRYVASIEIFERGTGDALLRIPVHRLNAGRPYIEGAASIQGKAIVYAKHRVLAPDDWSEFGIDTIADVPRRGEVIEAHHPVCTVFAQGLTGDECYAGLREMAEKVYTRLEPA